MKRTKNIISSLAVIFFMGTVQADETCMSPYMAKIQGQEDYVYVWTLGVEGLGDEQDKLVTIDVNPESSTYAQVVSVLSVGGRNEAHHSGLSDDRHYLWGGGLDNSSIFLFDIHSNPRKPKLHKKITNFVEATGGLVGPHTFYALPGRMMISALSNNADHGGRTGLAEYTNAGDYVATYWLPTDGDLQGATKTGKLADGYGYDVRVHARTNTMLTSSFTGWSNYMMDFGKMLSDGEAMKRFGNTFVIWDMHARQPKKVFDMPGAPLEIRCAWKPDHKYCFTTTALTSQVWLLYEDDSGEWQAKAVADIGDPSKIPLPVDISITADDKGLWIDTFMDGTARYFDITDPFNPKEVYQEKIGSQLNMVSQSWDGERVYFSTSLLDSWDKAGENDDQFVKLYDWDGQKLTHQWTVDFKALKLGRAHQMRFGSYSLYGKTRPTENTRVTMLNE